MHELRRLIQAQMDEHGMVQADLVRASSLSKQLVSKLVTDDRDRLDEMPARSTINALAKAFHLTEGAVLVVAARAYGVPVDEPTVIPTLEGVPDSQLAGELFRRLTGQEVSDGRESAPMTRLRAAHKATGPRKPPKGRR